MCLGVAARYADTDIVGYLLLLNSNELVRHQNHNWDYAADIARRCGMGRVMVLIDSFMPFRRVVVVAPSNKEAGASPSS